MRTVASRDRRQGNEGRPGPGGEGLRASRTQRECARSAHAAGNPRLELAAGSRARPGVASGPCTSATPALPRAARATRWWRHLHARLAVLARCTGRSCPQRCLPPKLSPLAALTSLAEFPNTRHPPAPAPSATFCEFATKSPQSRPRKEPLQKQMPKLCFVLSI